MFSHAPPPLRVWSDRNNLGQIGLTTIVYRKYARDIVTNRQDVNVPKQISNRKVLEK